MGGAAAYAFLCFKGDREMKEILGKYVDEIAQELCK